MNKPVLYLVLLLSACASDHQSGSTIGNATGAVLEQRSSNAVPQAVEPSLPVPTVVQQPANSDPVDSPLKKNVHNVEED